MGDKVLVDIAHQKADKHSHMATHYFLTHWGLHAQLREAGHEQGAVLLEVLGRASIAWLRPRQTEQWRTEALHACNVLVLRLFGGAIGDVKAIRGKKPVAGLTKNQLIDLIAINEARIVYLQRLSPKERAGMKETALTSR